MMEKLKLLLCFMLLAFAGCEKHPDPVVTKPVNDYTDTLAKEEVARLETKIKAHEQETSDQIAIVMVSSLGSRTIEELSLRIAEKWKGGQKGKDNGLLILIAKKEREIRFETGYGFEGRLPDGICGRIIRDEVVPHFKKKHFYSGIDNALEKIFLAVKGEYTGQGSAASQEERKNLMGILAAAAVCATVLLGSLHRFLGGACGALCSFFIVYFLYSTAWALPAAVLGFLLGLAAKEIAVFGGHGVGGSYSFGSGGGGGSWRGGGGSFGGGGASGSW